MFSMSEVTLKCAPLTPHLSTWRDAVGFVDVIKLVVPWYRGTSLIRNNLTP